MSFVKNLIYLSMLAIFSLSLLGCGGGAPEKNEYKASGSLLRSFTIVDDLGRASGTLTLNPLGGAELRDADGKLLGKFSKEVDSAPLN